MVKQLRAFVELNAVLQTLTSEENHENATDSSDENELDPLMEALERGKEKVSKATFRRQALEAEVIYGNNSVAYIPSASDLIHFSSLQAQQVGEISMEAQDVFRRATQELNEAEKALEGKEKLRDTLGETLQRIADEKKSVEDLIKQIAENSVEEM